MKTLLAIALLLFSSVTAAHYRVVVVDLDTQQKRVYVSCSADLMVIAPGDKDGTHITVTCNAPPLTEPYNYDNQPKANSPVFEFRVTGEASRFNCYVTQLFHESSWPGRLDVTCGTFSFDNGFEKGVAP
jgi:hypothetical protein